MRNHAILRFGIALFAMPLGLWLADVGRDRQTQLEVVASTKLLSLPPFEYPQSNPPVRMLMAGEEVRVLRMRLGKDLQAFRVETQDGAAGWIIRDDTVRIKKGA